MANQRNQNLLLIGIITGLLAGAAFGVLWVGHLQETTLAETMQAGTAPTAEVATGQVSEMILARVDFRTVKLLGELFINALRMMVVPLVLFSMITGIANLGDIRKVGRIGNRTLLYYFATTGLSVLLGIVLVNLIQPGLGSDVSKINQAAAEHAQSKHFSFFEVLEGLVHPNLVSAMAETKILPLILFSLVFGGILTTMGTRGRFVLRVAEGCNEAILKIVGLIIWLAPIGVFGLVGSKLGQEVLEGNLSQELVRLSKYVLTVILGLGLHGVVTLPLILWVFARRNPLSYFRAGTEALLTAFSTASSSATLPVTLDCVEKRGGVSSRHASFVCPLGATINMDGTALYESVAVIFIAQAIGHPLEYGDQIVIFLTATLASIGAAGIPEAGLVTMVLVFEAVGLDPIHIGTIFSIDWFLDRCRTTVNVWGDMVGAAVVAERSGDAEATPGSAVETG